VKIDLPNLDADLKRTMKILTDAAEMGLPDTHVWWLIGRMARVPEALELFASGIEMIEKKARAQEWLDAQTD
jgi:hypothetical protein